MTDESFELDVLADVIEVGNSETEESPPPKKRTQQRAEYKMDRIFGTVKEFEDWWKSEEVNGWHLDKRYTSKKTKVQTEFYR